MRAVDDAGLGVDGDERHLLVPFAVPSRHFVHPGGEELADLVGVVVARGLVVGSHDADDLPGPLDRLSRREPGSLFLELVGDLCGHVVLRDRLGCDDQRQHGEGRRGRNQREEEDRVLASAAVDLGAS